MPQRRARTEANRKTNVGVARAVPVLLLAIIGYASWVITRLVCVEYLRLNGSAIAVLTTYYLLLTILLISYGRLLYIVIRRPGLIPRGPQWYAQKARKSKRREKPADNSESGDLTKIPIPKTSANESLPFRVEDFWLRDVFVCNPDGRPPFCSECYNWKPDRAHHCSELNRCVAKMDHLCPWVGGVVGETSYKYFVQFTFYAAIFCTEVLTVVAYYFAQRRRSDTNFLNAHWVVMIAVSGLFLLFSSGMFMSSCQFALLNVTTIENLNRKTKVWNLAVYASPPVLEEAHEKGVELKLISYPRPPEEDLMIQGDGVNLQFPSNSSSPPAQSSVSHRTFAILESRPGQNPFHLGNLANFQDLMGTTIWEWLNPFSPSPAAQHSDPASLHKLGPAVDEMKTGTGLEAWRSEKLQRRRRRKSSSGGRP